MDIKSQIITSLLVFKVTPQMKRGVCDLWKYLHSRVMRSLLYVRYGYNRGLWIYMAVGKYGEYSVVHTWIVKIHNHFQYHVVYHINAMLMLLIALYSAHQCALLHNIICRDTRFYPAFSLNQFTITNSYV